jgi:hypothetical protein
MLRPLIKNKEEEEYIEFDKPTTESKENIDIIGWTEQVLFDCYLHFMNSLYALSPSFSSQHFPTLSAGSTSKIA